MKKKTDLQAVKALARAFLYFEPEETDYSPLVIKHPFTDSGIVGIQKKGGDICIGNILENSTDLNAWRKQTAAMIDRCDSAMQIAYLLTKSYSFGFLKYAQPHLDKADLSKLLAYMWVHTEQPNNDPNLSKHRLLSLFGTADPTVLMDEDEYLAYQSLPDTVTVYRGVTSLNADNIRALSWTLDYEKAEWFAHRFGEDGTVYEAQIDKEHILALFLSRGEAEVIVDPRQLRDIALAEAPGEGFTMTM